MTEQENTGLRYKDKVVIVTGGAMGIGKGIVSVFGRHGAMVIIADINKDVAMETEKTVREAGPGDATFVKCDITKKDDVTKMVEATLAKYGRIDCLVNNAGTALHGKVDSFEIEKVQLLLNVNVVGPFIVSQVCLPYLRKVKGNIVNIASIAGCVGQTGSTAYAMTKAANIGFTKSLAAEEGPTGVRVNCVAPGGTRTELFKKFVADMPERSANFFTKQCSVMGRLGEPEEIGMACLFLAADATYCTGAILNCTGGFEIDYGVKTGPNHIRII